MTFESFWQDTIADTRAEPLDAIVEHIPAPVHYPELINTASSDFYQMGWDWIERNL